MQELIVDPKAASMVEHHDHPLSQDMDSKWNAYFKVRTMCTIQNMILSRQTYLKERPNDRNVGLGLIYCHSRAG